MLFKTNPGNRKWFTRRWWSGWCCLSLYWKDMTVAHLDQIRRYSIYLCVYLIFLHGYFQQLLDNIEIHSVHSFWFQYQVESPPVEEVQKEVRTVMLGSFKWLSLGETIINKLQSWEDNIHFCPYKSDNHKWVLTCQSQLDKVKHYVTS